MYRGLSNRFASNAHMVRSNTPLTDDQMRAAAPSIFADDPHHSRSARYTYIPTIEVLNGLRREGFQPFMVCQARTRIADRREHTKHMIRLRHASNIIGAEANEIILVNSHDGSSAYQMLAGMFRFVCANGMICGETVGDVRTPHKGDVIGQVIDGAFTVLDSFQRADTARETMKAVRLPDGADRAFAKAALTLRYDDADAAPIRAEQLLLPRRVEDRGNDLWTTFNRVQENAIRGGQRGHNARGQRHTTRPVQGIDQNVKLNRALWVLAEEMAKLAA